MIIDKLRNKLLRQLEGYAHKLDAIVRSHENNERDRTCHSSFVLGHVTAKIDEISNILDLIKELEGEEEKEGKFKACPRCNNNNVEWTNSRDRDILTSWVDCPDCELHTFHTDSIAFNMLPNLDYKSALLKYNAWVDTSPKLYEDEDWS